jgi:hypothetical protein
VRGDMSLVGPKAAARRVSRSVLAAPGAPTECGRVRIHLLGRSHGHIATLEAPFLVPQSDRAQVPTREVSKRPGRRHRVGVLTELSPYRDYL